MKSSDALEPEVEGSDLGEEGEEELFQEDDECVPVEGEAEACEKAVQERGGVEVVELESGNESVLSPMKRKADHGGKVLSEESRSVEKEGGGLHQEPFPETKAGECDAKRTKDATEHETEELKPLEAASAEGPETGADAEKAKKSAGETGGKEAHPEVSDVFEEVQEEMYSEDDGKGPMKQAVKADLNSSN